MKRALKWIAAAVAVLALVAGAAIYSAFANNRPIEDGAEIGPGVRTIKDGFVSVFMIEAGPRKVVLIDAGNDKSGKAILAELARRGLDASAVAAIFLTHGHGDHTAACHLFPGAAVYAMEAERDVIGSACKVSRGLKDNDAVLVEDLQILAYAVPGHTPGSAVYFTHGVLFFGDSAGGAKDGSLMKAVRLFSKDSSQNVESLKALEKRLEPRASTVKTLAFAHSGPLLDFGPLRDFAASH